MSDMEAERDGLGPEAGLGDLPGGDEGDAAIGFDESGLGDAGVEAGLDAEDEGGIGDLPELGDEGREALI